MVEELNQSKKLTMINISEETLIKFHSYCIFYLDFLGYNNWIEINWLVKNIRIKKKFHRS